MFTGIVQAMGRITGVEAVAETRRITIETEAAFLAGATPGSSISVDGACLTPIGIEGGRFWVDVIGTTLTRTIAGRYRAGSVVNLERAMVLGGRLDGHLVQGHVDGVAFLRETREAGGFRLLELTLPEEVHRMTLLHGSIALNGVSLTVNRLIDPNRIEVGLIPHTWTHTNLGVLGIGDPVNVEGDLIGKYVGKLLLAQRRSPETVGELDHGI